MDTIISDGSQRITSIISKRALLIERAMELDLLMELGGEPRPWMLFHGRHIIPLDELMEGLPGQPRDKTGKWVKVGGKYVWKTGTDHTMVDAIPPDISATALKYMKSSPEFKAATTALASYDGANNPVKQAMPGATLKRMRHDDIMKALDSVGLSQNYKAAHAWGDDLTGATYAFEHHPDAHKKERQAFFKFDRAFDKNDAAYNSPMSEKMCKNVSVLYAVHQYNAKSAGVKEFEVYRGVRISHEAHAVFRDSDSWSSRHATSHWSTGTTAPYDFSADKTMGDVGLIFRMKIPVEQTLASYATVGLGADTELEVLPLKRQFKSRMAGPKDQLASEYAPDIHYVMEQAGDSDGKHLVLDLSFYIKHPKPSKRSRKVIADHVRSLFEGRPDQPRDKKGQWSRKGGKGDKSAKVFQSVKEYWGDRSTYVYGGGRWTSETKTGQMAVIASAFKGMEKQFGTRFVRTSVSSVKVVEAKDWPDHVRGMGILNVVPGAVFDPRNNEISISTKMLSGRLGRLMLSHEIAHGIQQHAKISGLKQASAGWQSLYHRKNSVFSRSFKVAMKKYRDRDMATDEALKLSSVTSNYSMTNANEFFAEHTSTITTGITRDQNYKTGKYTPGSLKDAEVLVAKTAKVTSGYYQREIGEAAEQLPPLKLHVDPGRDIDAKEFWEYRKQSVREELTDA